MATEELIERLLNAFQDLKKNFESRPTAWEEHITQSELSYLREIFSDRRNVLAECLMDIDQQIRVSVISVEDYMRIHRIMQMLNERLSELGAEPVALPEGLPGGNVADMIISRI
jgi:primosomal protein N''